MKVKAALLAMAMLRARVSLMLLALELNMKQREFIKTARQGAFDYLVPGIVPADNVVVAIIVGGASGLTATGVNQIFKQLKDKGDDDEQK